MHQNYSKREQGEMEGSSDFQGCMSCHVKHIFSGEGEQYEGLSLEVGR